ncbi:MAG: RNA polymerase sigma factor [Pirellulaceae bacterium]
MGDQTQRDGKAEPDIRPRPPDGEKADSPGSLTIQQVIDLYHASVYRYAYRLTGHVADAEDLAQQTFLIAQQKLGQVRDANKADRWLFAVVRSCFSKSRRRRRPTCAANLDLNMDAVAVEPPAAESIDREILERAWDELPDGYRLILAMFYFDEFSYKQIAQELEIPIGTVMSRLARAKQRLREQLASYDSTPQSG